MNLLPTGRRFLRRLGAGLAATGFLTLAAATAGAQGREPLRDSLPGQRLSWELRRVPAGDVTVVTADGPQRVRVAAFDVTVTEIPWELYDVFYLRLDVPRAERTQVDARSRPSRPYGAPDRGYGHRGFPAISLTHGAAERFAAWLSERTGQRYAVPTEAQWQRMANVALAGVTPDSIGEFAWLAANAEGTTHAVGTRRPDTLGLMDVIGNAAEWVTAMDGTPLMRGASFLTTRDSMPMQWRARQAPSWNATDPQDPKSRWWLSDGPFAGLRLVRIP